MNKSNFTHPYWFCRTGYPPALNPVAAAAANGNPFFFFVFSLVQHMNKHKKERKRGRARRMRWWCVFERIPLFLTFFFFMWILAENWKQTELRPLSAVSSFPIIYHFHSCTQSSFDNPFPCPYWNRYIVTNAGTLIENAI